MDRFAAGMIGFCICGCLVIICVAFTSMSQWIVAPPSAEFPTTRRDAINQSFGSVDGEKPRPGVGGSSAAPAGELPDDDSAAKVPERKGLSPRSPFYLLSDEDKNLFWWEIAKVATRQRGDDIVFRLDSAIANKLARRFNCTPDQVMEFFRDGSEADWLKGHPDDKL